MGTGVRIPLGTPLFGYSHCCGCKRRVFASLKFVGGFFLSRFLPLFLLFLSTNLLSDNIYYCSGKTTMCIRKIDGLWRADICNSANFIFKFNETFTELTYQKKIRNNEGEENSITERLKCKTVDRVTPEKNKLLLSESNGRLTCIDFDGSQLGIPEVLEEVIHFSSNKDRFSIYPMHSHSYIMNGPQADFVTFGTCSLGQ